MEILEVHIWPKAHVPPTYQLLFEQSHLHGQIYEVSGEFNTRNQSYSETSTIQVLHLTYSTIWIPIIVLQQSPPLIPHENPGENAEKSYHLDTRSIQNVAFRRTRSYCGTHPYKTPSIKTRKQILALFHRPPRESSHQNPHKWSPQYMLQASPSFDQHTHRSPENLHKRIPHGLKQQTIWSFPIFFPP